MKTNNVKKVPILILEKRKKSSLKNLRLCILWQGIIIIKVFAIDDDISNNQIVIIFCILTSCLGLLPVKTDQVK